MLRPLRERKWVEETAAALSFFPAQHYFFSPPSFDVSKIKIHKIRGVRLPARGGLFLGNRVQGNVYANRLLGYFIVCLRKNQAPHSFVDLSPGKWGGSAEINAADRVGGAPSLGAHGSITAKRVEAGRGIASCCGRMCVTLHQKQFGSAGGHALTTQGVGGRVGCLAGRNQGAKQLATQPAGPSWQSGAWMLLPCPGCARSLPAQLFPMPTKSALAGLSLHQGAKFPPAPLGSPNRREALAASRRGLEVPRRTRVSRSWGPQDAGLRGVPFFFWGDSCNLQHGDHSLGQPGPGPPAESCLPQGSTPPLRIPPLHPNPVHEQDDPSLQS